MKTWELKSGFCVLCERELMADDGASAKVLERWCDCTICLRCWAGVTHTCPVCGTSPWTETTEDEALYAGPASEPDRDLSGVSWVGWLLVCAVLAIVFAWMGK